jgi:drug/metabolite transporter (DMT)-like permease
MSAFCSFAKDTYAYLDPGTGSYFLRLFIAGLLGALFLIKAFWINILRTTKDRINNEKLLIEIRRVFWDNDRNYVSPRSFILPVVSVFIVCWLSFTAIGGDWESIFLS